MALRVTVFCLFVYYCFNVVPILCKKSIKTLSGGVNKQQEEIGSIIKHQEVSKSFRMCQEAPGRHNIKIIINKKQNTEALKLQVDYKNKHC